MSAIDRKNKVREDLMRKKKRVARKAPLEVRKNREEAMERDCLYSLSLSWPRDKVD